MLGPAAPRAALLPAPPLRLRLLKPPGIQACDPELFCKRNVIRLLRGCPPQPTAGSYEEGQAVNLTVRLTAAHKGRFLFRVCRIVGAGVAAEQAQLSYDCLNAHTLVQADAPGAQVGVERRAGEGGCKATQHGIKTPSCCALVHLPPLSPVRL
mgnify:CR=1 FL=1